MCSPSHHQNVASVQCSVVRWGAVWWQFKADISPEGVLAGPGMPPCYRNVLRHKALENTGMWGGTVQCGRTLFIVVRWWNEVWCIVTQFSTVWWTRVQRCTVPWGNTGSSRARGTSGDVWTFWLIQWWTKFSLNPNTRYWGAVQCSAVQCSEVQCRAINWRHAEQVIIWIIYVFRIFKKT